MQRVPGADAVAVDTRSGSAFGMLVRGWLAGAAVSTARCTADSLVVGERLCRGTRTHWRPKAGSLTVPTPRKSRWGQASADAGHCGPQSDRDPSRGLTRRRFADRPYLRRSGQRPAGPRSSRRTTSFSPAHSAGSTTARLTEGSDHDRSPPRSARPLRLAAALTTAGALMAAGCAGPPAAAPAGTPPRRPPPPRPFPPTGRSCSRSWRSSPRTCSSPARSSRCAHPSWATGRPPSAPAPSGAPTRSSRAITSASGACSAEVTGAGRGCGVPGGSGPRVTAAGALAAPTAAARPGPGSGPARRAARPGRRAAR